MISRLIPIEHINRIPFHAFVIILHLCAVSRGNSGRTADLVSVIPVSELVPKVRKKIITRHLTGSTIIGAPMQAVPVL